MIFKTVVSLRSCVGMKNKVVAGIDGWLFYEPELTYIADSLPLDNIDRIAGFDRTLRGHGMTLFVVPIPNKIEIYPDKFTAFPSPQPVKSGRLQLIRGLEKAGVRVIDLTPAFEQARQRGDCVFNQFESHWTIRGVEIAAQAIADHIGPLLTQCGITGTVDYIVKDTVFRMRGDLLGRVCDVERQTWYSLPINQVWRADGGPYDDDRQSPILILGDSFVNHGKWLNAHLGAHLARFLRRPTRTYFSLLANTEGPSMYSRKPGVFPAGGIVVWAFSSRVLQYHLGVPKNKAGD